MADSAKLLILGNLTAGNPWLKGIRSELNRIEIFTSSQWQSTGGESHLHENGTILSASNSCLNLANRTWFETELASALVGCKSLDIALVGLDIL